MGQKWCGYTDNHETCLQTCCMCKKAFRALGMVERAMPNSTPCCSHSQLATVKLVATSIPVLSSFIYELKWKQYGTSPSIFPQLSVKVHPRTDHESPEGQEKYSSALSLTLVLDGGVGGQGHTPTTLPRGKRPGIHCKEGCVSARAGLDRCWKTRPIGIRSLDHPARSGSLYLLLGVNYFI